MSRIQTARFSYYFGLFLLFLTMGLAPRATLAASFVVSSTADNANSAQDPTTLRGAIAASQASPDVSDTITINASGTVSLTQGELLISNPRGIAGKTVTLIGPGAGTFAVSGNNTGGTSANQTRVLHITDGTVLISGVTLTQGHIVTGTTGGAGILLEGATLTLSHCVVSNSSVIINSAFGGGIANIGGDLTLTSSVVTGCLNTSSSGGGGIGSENGALTLRNCTVNNNQAFGSGGGIASFQETLSLTRTAITANSAQGSGGGLSIQGDQATLTDCTIANNEALNVGYGLSVSGGIGNTVRMTGCSLTGNANVQTTGGGFGYTLFNAGAALSMTNCSVFANLPANGGSGGVYNAGTLTLADSTITQNSVTQSSIAVGGLYNDTSGTATVTSTILAHNAGANVLTATPGAIKSGGSNLIGDPSGNGFVNDPNHADPNSSGNHDQTGVTQPGMNILSISNGGPTPTVALIAGSPAIDGDFADATPSDQRGAPRPFGVRNDIGAFEYGATAPPTPVDTYLVTNINDRGPGSLRQAIFDANADPGATIAFDPATFGPGKPQTITLTSGELIITQGLTITGPGAALLSISGGDVSRVFNTGGSGMISITGLTITHGKGAELGGGIAVGGIGSSVALTDCVISHCTVTLVNGSAGGGGIGLQFGHLTLTRCTITANSAPGGAGGGIDVNLLSIIYGNMTMTDCTVSGNSASLGGGIEISNPGVVATVETSTISGNTATTGGGIDIAGILSLITSTIANNTATTGGGVNATDGVLILARSTLTGNTATTGGGLDLTGTTLLTAISSILAGNSGGNVVKAATVTVTSGGANLLGDPNGNGFTNGVSHDLTGVTNPKLGPLQNNGGPTQTIALLSGSPAIDGDFASPLSGDDQRGAPRPQGVREDIGAYESGVPVARDDGYTIKENKSLAVQAPGVLANDVSDSVSPKLTATLEDKPTHGSLTLNHDGSFAYTPNTGFLGIDTFTYQVADGSVAGTTGTVTLTVVNVSSPTTTATISPTAPNGSNGYYTVPVTITLKATLAANDPGPVTVLYALDGPAQKTYTTPFKISADGAHTLTFFSQTPQGGAETAKKATFAIDRTAPVTTAGMKSVTSSTQITLTAKDTVSGVASTVYTLDGGAAQTYTAPFTVTSTAAHTIVFHSTDKAGNVEKAQTLTVASGTIHTFATGLQMFSVPADYSALTLGQSLTQSGTASAPTLATWVPSLVNYVLSPTAPADHLRPGQGYWVKLTGTGSLNSMGTPTPTSMPFKITLGEGWNMIGDPFTTPISLANVVVTAGGRSYTGIGPASSAGVVSYLLYSYPAGSSGYVSENGTGTLAPYLGYWVYAFQPCTLQITAP